MPTIDYFSVSINSFRPGCREEIVLDRWCVDRCCVDGLGQSARAVRDGQGGRLSDIVMN